MSTKIELPTDIRMMSSTEYSIVTRVMGDTLPYRQRIFITNACGERGRAFTIPTSLLTTILNTTVSTFFGGVGGGLGAGIGGYLTSVVNLAYLINVGSDFNNLETTEKNLLVHETMHVWQGKNSVFALSYVFDSIINQSLSGGSAYNYTLGQAWSSYNVEQQASIVEDWFARGESTSDAAFTYIDNHVRQGDA